MTRNSNIYVPKLSSEEIAPGFVLGHMAFFMGFHIGYFQLWVIIDQEKEEYNTAASIHGGGFLGIPKENVEKLNADGYTLTNKEMKTIVDLLSSDRFKAFSKSAPPYKYFDSGESILSIRSRDDKVYLCAENFNFYRRDKLCRTAFQWKCRWWTRGLKHIFLRLQGKA